MALAVRQTLASARASGTSLARTFASNPLAGSLLVAHGGIYNAGGSGEPTVSDGINGTWASQTTTGYFISGDADSEIWLWSFPNCGAGATTVTVNPPGTNSDNDLTLIEVTGAATSSPRDVTVTNTGAVGGGTLGATTAVTTGTLAQAAEIIISSFSHTTNNRVLTEDTAGSFTAADENESNATGQTYHVQYKIVAATTSVVVNGTIGTIGTDPGAWTWFTGVASFKEAASAAASFPFRQHTLPLSLLTQ